MNYRQLYIDLATTLTNLKCAVCDFDFLGFCTVAKGKKAFIYINPKMTYKEKYFVLAHEAGHLFYMKKGKVFNWSGQVRTEKQANKFAIQLLNFSKIRSEEYYNFYDKTKKVRPKKSWFQLKEE